MQAKKKVKKTLIALSMTEYVRFREVIFECREVTDT